MEAMMTVLKVSLALSSIPLSSLNGRDGHNDKLDRHANWRVHHSLPQSTTCFQG
jgi:hypothetical protein